MDVAVCILLQKPTNRISLCTMSYISLEILLTEQYNHELNHKISEEKEMSRGDHRFLERAEQSDIRQNWRFCLKLPFKCLFERHFLGWHFRTLVSKCSWETCANTYEFVSLTCFIFCFMQTTIWYSWVEANPEFMVIIFVFGFTFLLALFYFCLFFSTFSFLHSYWGHEKVVIAFSYQRVEYRI